LASEKWRHAHPSIGEFLHSPLPLNAGYASGCMSSMRLPNGSFTYTRS
jgi:hypothetical protein